MNNSTRKTGVKRCRARVADRAAGFALICGAGLVALLPVGCTQSGTEPLGDSSGAEVSSGMTLISGGTLSSSVHGSSSGGGLSSGGSCNSSIAHLSSPTADPAALFTVRSPGSHSLTCTAQDLGTSQEQFQDKDFVCAFTLEGQDALLYLQATPTSCVPDFYTAEYGTVTGRLSLDGAPAATPTAVAYDWGGNHENNRIDFTWEGKEYSLYHSSFGWGWRKCQEMDCLQVRSGATLETDGCTVARSLPAICVPVGAGGSVPALVDTFEPCLGDPNYP